MTGNLGLIRGTPALAPYADDVIKWQDYIRTTAAIKFHVHGYEDTRDGFEDVAFDMPYKHRWEASHEAGIISSTYQLEAWHKEHPHYHTGLMTCTGYTGWYESGKKAPHDISIEEAFTALKKAVNKLLKMLRKYVPGFEYWLIWEAHKTGYPHCHAVIFSLEEITQGLQDKLKNLWEQKYQAGSAERGIKFDLTRPEQKIKSLRNYLMKYLVKTFKSPKSKYPIKPRTPAQVVFNALAYKHGWRFQQKSQLISKVMAYQPKENRVNYYGIDLSRPLDGVSQRSELRQVRTVWAVHPYEILQGEILTDWRTTGEPT